MERNDFNWLCAELGLPAVVESDGEVVPNAAALAAGCPERAPYLEAAVCALLGQDSLDADALSVLRRARAGEACTASIQVGASRGEHLRLIAVPNGAGCARVAVAPVGRADDAEVSRRANLVDVAAAVSHEVANAVGAIAGWAQLATSPGADVSKDEALTLIASCARTAQLAARGMLGLARGEACAQPESIDLSGFATELLTLLSVTAREARVHLTSHIEDGVAVLGSRSTLFTVVWNLTKNAIEACSAGGTVVVRLAGVDARVVLEVCDTGKGLDDDEQARVFSPYYTTKTHGTGLGLALVKKATVALGGALALHSRKGEGASFRVTLPRAPTAACAGSAAPGTPSGVAPARLAARILVVDDDDALREMIVTALSLRGAEVVSAKSGKEAHAAEGRFDIALIDMMLDESRGDELLAALRRRGTVTAAMLVTGTVQKPRLVPGGEPDDWLRKPFDVSLLIERVRRTLERHSMLNSVAATGMR